MSTNTFYTKYLNNKNLTYLCLAIIICSFIINYLNIFDFKPDLNGDNVYYYALGRALAAGKGYTDIIFFEETPHSHFPPGYPLFNAGIMLFTHSYSALKIANGVLFGLSILLLFFLTKKLSGNLLLALSTCLLCCMQQALLRYSTIVMSEMLFTFLTIGVLYLISLINTDHLFDKHRPRSQIIYFILMIIGLNYIYFVRTMGTSIILAVIIYFGIICIKKSITFFKSKRTHADLSQQIKNKQALFSHLIILGIVIVSFAGAKTAWDMRNKSIGVTGSDYLKDFKKKPKGEIMTTFSDWTERVENNLTSYVGKWIPSAIVSDNPELEQSVTRSGIIQGICILAIVLLGLITLKKLQLLLFLYIGITMAVLMVWPEQYGGHRYFIGIIPLFIFLFLNGCLELINFITKKMPLAKYQQLIPAGGLILLLVFFHVPALLESLEAPTELRNIQAMERKNRGPRFHRIHLCH